MSWIDDLIDTTWRLPVALVIVTGLFTLPVWLPKVLEVLS